MRSDEISDDKSALSIPYYLWGFRLTLGPSVHNELTQNKLIKESKVNKEVIFSNVFITVTNGENTIPGSFIDKYITQKGRSLNVCS